MKRKIFLYIASSVLLIYLSVQTVFAFTDVKSDQQSANQKINQLQQDGILNGVGDNRFAPNAPLTDAGAVALLVKGFGLNIDNIRTIKKAEATDFFQHVANDKWYSDAFVIAHFNNIPLPSGIMPDQKATRQQFAFWLYNALNQSMKVNDVQPGPISNMMMVAVTDIKQIPEDQQKCIQQLLRWQIVTLTDDQKFRPSENITRSEAAVMLYNARQFMKDQTTPLPSTQDHANDKVQMDVQSVNQNVKKVILDWGTKPTTGYAVIIDQIDFSQKGKAVIEYHLVTPEPGGFQGQMVTNPRAITYIDASLTPVLQQKSLN